MGLYKDAYLMGEAYFLELAIFEAQKAQAALLAISQIKSLDQKTITDVNECLKKLKEFTKDAQDFYRAEDLSGGITDLESSSISKITAIADRTKQLREELLYFSEEFADKLKTELSAISKNTKQQRYLNMVVFFLVVSAALFLVSIIINRTISRPLKKTFMLEKAVEQSADGIAVIDTSGKLEFINRAWAQMHGYEVSELTGKQEQILYTEDNFKNKITHFNEIVATSGYCEKEVWHIKKDGTEFPVMLTGNLLSSRRKKTSSLVCNARDITEQKKSEQKIMEANLQLQRESERANKMAVEAKTANRAKSSFLANMSHEIRTPMNGVIGMAELLLDSALDDTQRYYTHTVKDSGESLLGILNDILDFSKIEAGRLDIEEIDFDLKKLMDDFAASMSFKTEEKGLEFICSADPELPSFVKGDPVRIRQVLTNLTGNAIKFTNKGEVAVLCRLDAKFPDSIKLHFSINDTGIGIAKDKQKLLFEKFTQADSSTTRNFGGTGLGLSISKQLVELMGGEIGLESVEGQGATFWFKILLKNSDMQPESIEIGDLRNARVLFIDDNKTNREVVGAMLSYRNIEHSVMSAFTY